MNGTNLDFLNVTNSLDDGVLKILNDNVIGTPGQSMLYMHRGVDKKIKKISSPYYVTIKRNNSIVGTCCFCKRNTWNWSVGNIQSFYIRYFSFINAFRRKSTGEKNKLKYSLIKEEIKLLLKGEGLVKNREEKFFHYAYVDPHNLRSAILCEEFGFQPVREFVTILFNRINLKEKSPTQVEELSFDKKDSIKDLLASFYKNYHMFSFENLDNENKYYVVRNFDNEIIAGVQVNYDYWKILSLPGFTGRAILNTFSRIPYLNRIVNKDYHFLAFDGIYVVPGFENHLEILIETLLARYKVHSAIIVVDPETQLYKTLKSLNLGWAHRLSKEVRGNVICNFVNFTDEEKKSFKINPAYISGMDVT